MKIYIALYITQVRYYFYFELRIRYLLINGESLPGPCAGNFPGPRPLLVYPRCPDKEKCQRQAEISGESHLICPAQVRPVLVQDAVSPLGLLPLLSGFDCGVAPHVGPAVSAGDVEESDALELGALCQS